MKDFIPYQQALTLKELGFYEPCFGYFLNNNKFYLFNDCKWEERTNSDFIDHFMDRDISCVVPTFSQSFRFFREKYGLSGYPFSQSSQTNIWFKYFVQQEWKDQITSDSFITHEEAELECLKKLIEIVKTMNDAK